MTVVDVLAYLAFVPAVAFPVLYSFFPWRENPAGRSVMLLSVVIALALSMSVWRQIVDQAPPQWYRITVFVLVIIALWTQLITLVVLQRRNRSDNGSPQGR